MTEHFATAFEPTKTPRFMGDRWSEIPDWNILCSCGEIVRPYQERGTSSPVISATDAFREHFNSTQNRTSADRLEETRELRRLDP